MSKVYYDEGAYVGEVIGQALGEGTGAKKTPYFMLKVKVLGTPDGSGGFIKEDRQYERSVYFYLTEKTVEFTAENLAGLGFRGKISELDPDHPKAHIFKGQIDLYCKHEEYNGQWSEKWWLSRVLDVPKLDAKKTRQLDSLFSKAMKNAAPVGMKKPEAEDENQDERHPVTNHHNVEIDDDDVPF